MQYLFSYFPVPYILDPPPSPWGAPCLIAPHPGLSKIAWGGGGFTAEREMRGKRGIRREPSKVIPGSVWLSSSFSGPGKGL